MEIMMQEVQTTPEQIVKLPDQGECPTCASGADPNIGNALFLDALRDSL